MPGGIAPGCPKPGIGGTNISPVAGGGAANAGNSPVIGMPAGMLGNSPDCGPSAGSSPLDGMRCSPLDRGGNVWN